MKILGLFRGRKPEPGNLKLIVGLGNPGPRYEKTRHNLGFMCLGYFAREHNIRLAEKEGATRTGAGEVAGQGVILARPQTYMNLSGRAVAGLAAKHKISPEDIIVIHDEMDLPLGRIRLRGGGGSGGHNGIKSIIEELGSRDFLRVRVGIGRPPEGGRTEADSGVIDFLLSDFMPAEMEKISEVIPEVSAAVLCLLIEGLTQAMNKYNSIDKGS